VESNALGCRTPERLCAGISKDPLLDKFLICWSYRTNEIKFPINRLFGNIEHDA
jgi:hypothetical protein